MKLLNKINNKDCLSKSKVKWPSAVYITYSAVYIHEFYFDF